MTGSISKTILSVVALIVGIGTNVFSQNEGLRFELIPGELSRRSIRAITQDDRGFLWVGTSSGLIRYDGYSSIVFAHHPADSTSLSDNIVTTLMVTHREQGATLWIGTGNGLNRFDPEQETFVQYKHDPNNPRSLSHNLIKVLMADRHGNLWIGTVGGGLCRLNAPKSESADKQPTFVRYIHDPDDPASIGSNSVLAISEDNDGSLWIGTTGGGLNRFVPATESFIRYPEQPGTQGSRPLKNVSAVLASHDGQQLWIGAFQDGSLHRIEIKRGSHNSDQSPSIDFAALEEIGAMSVSTIYEDRNEILWIGTPGSGLLKVDRKEQTASKDPGLNSGPAQARLTSYRNDTTDPNSLSGDHILSIFEDSSGILWIGTTSGLHKLSYSVDKFITLKHEPENPNSVAAVPVTSVWEDRYGWLWLGTGDGLNVYDPVRDRFLLFKHDPADDRSLRKNYIGTVYGDKTGHLWVGTFGGGLSRLDLDAFHRSGNARFNHYVRDKNDPHSIEGNFIYSILEDRHGNLWVGGHALSKLNSEDRPTTKFTILRHDPDNPASLLSGGIMSLFEDQHGNIWIGGDGLARYDSNSEKFIRFMHDSANPNSLSNNNIGPIYEDASGTLWIGTDSGLNKFDSRTGTFTSYFERDGLPDNAISGILGDDDGNLWISTESGLCRFNEKLPEGRRFRNYDVNYDLQGNEPYFNSYHQGRDGEMFFGGSAGITRFYPAQVKDNQHLPPVVITDFKLFNEPVLIGGDSPLHKSITESKEITLSYEHNFFSFEFAALDYTAPGKNQYAYMMDGFDADWIYIGSRRYANYTNLDPGRYTFRVKGANNDGVWNENGASIRLLITPPFWQTWWFTAIGFILVGSILYGVHVAKLQRTLEIERIRSRIASDLHDDIGAGLTHIGLLSEVSLRKTGGDRLKKISESGAVQELSSSIERVGSIARELSLAMSDVVWSINPNHDSVESLQHRLTAFATEICEAKKIKLNIDVSATIAKVKLNPEIRRHLLLIAKEALHNMAKYSETDSVNLKIEANNKNIILEVADFGKGFDLKNSTKGNGLVNMRSRVEKMGGECNINSQIGKGTKIKATVPFKS